MVYHISEATEYRSINNGGALDPRSLSKTYERVRGRIDWTDWVHVGESESFRIETVLESMKSFFSSRSVYVLRNRREYGLRLLKEAASLTRVSKEVPKIIVVSENLDRFMEIQMPGVLRTGTLSHAVRNFDF